MINCLVAAATPLEISPFLDHHRNHVHFNKKNVDVLITGVGLVASTFSLQKQVYLKRPHLIIQAGIAGCFDRSVELGKVVAIKQDTIADQGVIEKKLFKTMFDLKFIAPDQFPYKKGWLINPNNELLKKTGLKSVKAVSVNQVSTGKPTLKSYQELFQPVVESMEGAALHYVGLIENIPFIQLRSISNYVGERDKKKWKIKESVVNLNNQLIRLLESL